MIIYPRLGGWGGSSLRRGFGTPRGLVSFSAMPNRRTRRFISFQTCFGATSIEAHSTVRLKRRSALRWTTGILILIMPSLLNYIVAIYLIIVGLIGLNGIYHFIKLNCPTSLTTSPCYRQIGSPGSAE